MRVALSESAIADFEVLVRSHSLPLDTRSRIGHRLRDLERFPLLGVALGGRWSGMRAILGPWRWLILVYVVLDEEGRVVVVSMQDGRSAIDVGPA